MSNQKLRKLNIDVDKFKSLVEGITNKEAKVPSLPQDTEETTTAPVEKAPAAPINESEKIVMSESYKERMKLLAGITK